MRRRIVCCLAMAIAVAFCFLKSYDISPTHYSLSGWTPTNGYVAETFIANFDSAAEVDFFVGDVDGLSNGYNVDIYEYPGGITRVAYRHDITAPKSYAWVQFPMTQDPENQRFSKKVILTE